MTSLQGGMLVKKGQATVQPDITVYSVLNTLCNVECKPSCVPGGTVICPWLVCVKLQSYYLCIPVLETLDVSFNAREL